MHWFELFLFILAICFLLSGVDDLFIDLIDLFASNKLEKRSEQQWREMDSLPEQKIAVMVPAWKEQEVISQMIRTNTRRIAYANYRWFVGVYPNDSETLTVAKELELEFPKQVKIIVVDRPGPSTKAHCLNVIFNAICADAKEKNWEPDLIALHDAEDVVHPDAFKLINAYPHEIQFFQIPIFSLATPLTDLVAGTYLDEFAENHLKEIPARQTLKMPIPSAGVGTFIRFATLLRVKASFGFVFSEEGLAEDYELSMCLAYLGIPQCFVTVRGRDQKYLIATHAYFPHRFRASVRQKTRWVIGITLQGCRERKPKTLLNAYARFRDRKGLFTNPINLLGWVGFLTMGVLFFEHHLPSGKHVELLARLFFVNFVFLLIRAVQRFRFTFLTYGLAQAFVGVFRILLVNFINMAATFRAIYQYHRQGPLSPSQKKSFKWDKTDHRFPDASEISIAGPHAPRIIL